MNNNINLYSRVFRWLAMGLLVSFLGGYVLSLNDGALLGPIITSGTWTIAIVVQVLIALLFGVLLKKINYTTCIIFYLIYCAITGLDIGCVLLVYEMSSVIYIFIATSAIFAFLSFIGDKLNVDVTKLGTILVISLIGVIVFSILNMLIFHSEITALFIAIIALVVFLGFIIYDLKIVEPLADFYGEDKAAIYSAFQLYIDFINVFIRLLEIFGKRRD